MSYVKIAGISELKSGDKKRIVIDTKAILLVNVDGHYYAVDNTCPHMGGDLSLGELQGSNIICPRHHTAFDVTNGKAVKDGKLLFMAVKPHDLKTYEVKIAEDQIQVDL